MVLWTFWTFALDFLHPNYPMPWMTKSFFKLSAYVKAIVHKADNLIGVLSIVFPITSKNLIREIFFEDNFNKISL